MTDTPDNLVLTLLREMRAESTAQFEELNLKIETLAGSMVSMRKDINELKDSVERIRIDVRMIAIAVDGHGARLDKMEETLERFKH